MFPAEWSVNQLIHTHGDKHLPELIPRALISFSLLVSYADCHLKKKLPN